MCWWILPQILLYIAVQNLPPHLKIVTKPPVNTLKLEDQPTGSQEDQVVAEPEFLEREDLKTYLPEVRIFDSWNSAVSNQQCMGYSTAKLTSFVWRSAELTSLHILAQEAKGVWGWVKSKASGVRQRLGGLLEEFPWSYCTEYLSWGSPHPAQ